MAYKGSDLPNSFRDFFRREKSKITKILKAKGCTNIKLDYGFWYFSGFYTAPNGQIWYILSSDCRGPYSLIYRTAKSYSDYTGGANNNLQDLHKLPPV